MAVVVSGACGAVTNTTPLTINQNTSATPLMSLARAGGDSATFSTTASGTGPFSYQWTKDGMTLTGVTDNSYTIPSVTASDAGTYCVVVNGACSSVTNCASLTVNTPPVLAAIADQTLYEGTTLMLNIEATDSDVPANHLTYNLVAAPAGAYIDSASGAFIWTPAEADLGSTQTVTVRVTDLLEFHSWADLPRAIPGHSR